LLQNAAMNKVIVFSKTKHGANRILSQLEAAEINAAAIHGNKSQGARQKALEAFKNGNIRVLVATDIVARGIDVDNISHVINYDLPDEPESYVHRIGRTARAGREGVAIAFCCSEELEQLRDIERTIGQELEVDASHPFAVRLERMPARGRSSTPSSRQDRFRRPQGGHQHQSRHRREGEGRERPYSSEPPSENLRSELGEKRSQDSSGRRDRPRHEADRGGRPAATGIGRHESSPARHDAPRHGASRSESPRGQSRGGGGGGRRRSNGPKSGGGTSTSSSSAGSESILGGVFKAFKKRFGS
ncbi:MAG TPA: C-terminal helicase domain-containing protein, partial [bacterium]|nr:C-terminal helicase domain-containing protein [bacterium]